ncbi:hypothetical protein [Dethiobacter alkaliphilus]|nr:hypothetical protein [Dethiobacter alkaliphilus]MCW3491621.1 hypothetical protein [Dethiobacter alkaliphilus]
MPDVAIALENAAHRFISGLYVVINMPGAFMLLAFLLIYFY